MHGCLFLALFGSMFTAASSEPLSEERLETAKMHVQDAFTNCSRIIPSRAAEVSPGLPDFINSVAEQAEFIIEFLRCELGSRDGAEPARYIALLSEKLDGISKICDGLEDLTRSAYSGFSKAYEACSSILRWQESIESYEFAAGLFSEANPAERTGSSKPTSAEEAAERGIVDSFSDLTDANKIRTLKALSEYISSVRQEIRFCYAQREHRQTKTCAAAFIREQISSMEQYGTMAYSLTYAVVSVAELVSVMRLCAPKIRSAVSALGEAWSFRRDDSTLPPEALTTLDDCRRSVHNALEPFNKTQRNYISMFVRRMSKDRMQPIDKVPLNNESWVGLHRRMIESYKNTHHVTMQIAQEIEANLRERFLNVDELAGKIERAAQVEYIASQNRRVTRPLGAIRTKKNAIWELYKDSKTIVKAAFDDTTKVYEFYTALFRCIKNVELYEASNELLDPIKPENSAMPPEPKIQDSLRLLTDGNKLDALSWLYKFVDEHAKELDKCYLTGPFPLSENDPQYFIHKYVHTTKDCFELGRILYKYSTTIAEYSLTLKDAASKLLEAVQTSKVLKEQKISPKDTQYRQLYFKLSSIGIQIHKAGEKFVDFKFFFFNTFMSFMNQHRGKPAAELTVPSWDDYSQTWKFCYDLQTNRQHE
ncbi:hypothetical protein PAPHI01_1744 [Pancytospora philotis]|nr:hypothetical protein PAPHI01_1744 [Pancytospora philotis]